MALTRPATTLWTAKRTKHVARPLLSPSSVAGVYSNSAVFSGGRTVAGLQLAVRVLRGMVDSSWLPLTAVNANSPGLPAPDARDFRDDMPADVGLLLLRDFAERWGDMCVLGHTSDLLFVATVARLPARHWRMCRVRGARIQKRSRHVGGSRLNSVCRDLESCLWSFSPKLKVCAPDGERQPSAIAGAADHVCICQAALKPGVAGLSWQCTRRLGRGEVARVGKLVTAPRSHLSPRRGAAAWHRCPAQTEHNSDRGQSACGGFAAGGHASLMA